jgi:uncharacterized protein YecT (DUF1311 family)
MRLDAAARLRLFNANSPERDQSGANRNSFAPGKYTVPRFNLKPITQFGIAAIVAAFGFTERAAAAPSFDCRSVSVATERTICRTPSIHPIDLRLDALYRTTLSKARRVSDARAVEIVRNAQRKFLIDRNACGTDIDCIRITYRGQFSALRAYLRQLD